MKVIVVLQLLLSSIAYSLTMLTAQKLSLSRFTRPCLSIGGRLRALQVSRLGSSVSNRTIIKHISSPEQMEEFGGAFASVLRAGDVVLLTGDVGAGKTTFSRGVVQSLIEDFSVRVTSPTYLLSNHYEGEKGVQVHHFDLYRLSGRKDLSTLDIPGIFPKTISLIEWPDRLGEHCPQRHIDLRISIEPDDHRTVSVSLIGPDWNHRLDDFRWLESGELSSSDGN